jgi:cytochrome c-type biogenesis protein CcmH
MMLWMLLALMTVVAVLAVLWPLARSEARMRSGSDLAVYRDQLDEIQRDRAAGLIGEKEAEAAQIEVSRRLLAAADTATHAVEPAVAAPAWRRRAVAIVAILAVPMGAGALYLTLGSPSLPGQPLAQRQEQGQSLDHMIAQIEDHLAKNPNDARGWEVIGPVYLRLGRFDDAAKAWRSAMVADKETAARQSSLGEALVGAANGVVTADAKRAFERAVELDPMDVKGRFFLGLAADQDGRPSDAAAIWRGMVDKAPPGAPWADFVKQEIARVEHSPGKDDVAAASDMMPEQRTAMIRGMVDQLSERLHKEGSDVEGWLRLVRSYMVLGERDKARAAAGDARRALGNEPDKLRRIDDLVKGLGLEG